MTKTKLLFFLTCIACLRLHAQSEFGKQWDSLYFYLKDKGQLNSGYFWDLALPDPALDIYSGSASDSLSDYDGLINLYSSFRNAALAPQNNEAMAMEKEFNRQMAAQLSSGLVAVPVLDVKAGRVKKTAYTDGSLIFDKSVQAWLPVKGDTDIFELHSVFTSAPYVRVVYHPELRFLFSNDFLLSNTGRTIEKIRYRINGLPESEIDPGKIALMELSEGINTFQVVYEMSDGMHMHTAFEMLLDQRDLSSGVPDKFLLSNPFHFGDEFSNIYAEPERPTETRDKAGAFIDFLPGNTGGVPNRCILKPLVIVEGIDFGFENRPTGCFGGKCGSMGLLDLHNGFLTNPHAPKGRSGTEEWNAIKKAPELLRQLRDRGYDVYYVDFHNGADYMENNAMVLVEFIKQLNLRKCSNEEIVVLGASMGGVVARYALTYMEKHNMPHCVRTFLSFDAPQQGANIPLGLQSFMQYYSGKLPTFKRKFEQKIDRPATKQLLIYHTLSQYQSRGHDERNAFMLKLKSIGVYPKHCRNIALSNGSIDESQQIFKPGDRLLGMNPYLSGELPEAMQIWANVYAMAKPMPDSTYIVLEAKSYMQKNVYVKTLDDNTLFTDHLPGSIRYDLREARTIYGFFNVVNYHSSASFIPTFSSLDIYNTDSKTPIHERIPADEPAPEHYPFEAYLGVRQTNQEHMMITDENIAWTIEQIEVNRNEIAPVLTGVYNFNRRQRRKLSSVSIESNAVLQINGNYMGGYGNGPFDKAPVPGSTFEAYTSECGPLLVINQKGSLVLGDRNKPMNQKAILHVRKGTTLMIKSGGILRVHDGSRLIIEEGAVLMYEKGARIILEGKDAVLYNEGKIVLGSKSVFNIEKGSAAQSGYLVLRNPDKSKAAVLIETMGGLAGINLQGSTKMSDLILQVEGKVAIGHLNQTLTVNAFRIGNARVQYGSMASLQICGNVTIDTAVFEPMPRTGGNTQDALILLNAAQIHVAESDFSRLRHAINIYDAGQASVLKVRNCSFEKCVFGIKSKNCNAEIRYSVFKSCGFAALKFESPATFLLLESLGFQENYSALEVNHKSAGLFPVLVSECDFVRNITGVSSRACQLNVRCTRFTANGTGISDVLSEINFSRNREHVHYGITMSGGNNTFAYNTVAGVHVNASMLYLAGGLNNFLNHDNKSNSCFVSGELAYSTTTHGAVAPYLFDAAGNYWSPLPSGGLQSGSGLLYNVRFPYPGTQGSTENLFSGNTLADLNTMCYTRPGNPADFVTDESCNHSDTVSKQIKKVQFSIYPYPADKYLHIVWSDSGSGLQEQTELRLYSMDGKLLLEHAEAAIVFDIRTETIADGMYILCLKRGNAERKEKVYVRH